MDVSFPGAEGPLAALPSAPTALTAWLRHVRAVASHSGEAFGECSGSARRQQWQRRVTRANSGEGRRLHQDAPWLNRHVSNRNVSVDSSRKGNPIWAGLCQRTFTGNYLMSVQSQPKVRYKRWKIECRCDVAQVLQSLSCFSLWL